MIKHKRQLYREVTAITWPAWVQKLQQGVQQDDRAKHRHILEKIKILQRELDHMDHIAGAAVFDQEDVDLIVQFRKMLNRYNFPMALVEKAEEDEIFYPGDLD